MCSNISLFEDFLKLELPGPPENPPHSQELLQTLLVPKSSSFVHLLSFPLDKSFFLIAILINMASERLIRLFSASRVYPANYSPEANNSSV